MDREAEDRQWKMLEALDSILYYHFEEALAQNSAVFQLTLNGVDMECAYTVREGQLQYTATRIDNQKQEHYVFMVDLDEVDDSILADDITEARVVTAWLVEGWHCTHSGGMLMYQYTCDSKYCATCSSWSGERKICDHFGSRLEVSSPMATGKCMNRKSGCFQQTKQANGGCSAHEKWGALR